MISAAASAQVRTRRPPARRPRPQRMAAGIRSEPCAPPRPRPAAPSRDSTSTFDPGLVLILFLSLEPTIRVGVRAAARRQPAASRAPSGSSMGEVCPSCGARATRSRAFGRSAGSFARASTRRPARRLAPVPLCPAHSISRRARAYTSEAADGGAPARGGAVLRPRLHHGPQQVDEDRAPVSGHQDVTGRDVAVSDAVLVQVGQGRAQNIQKGRQLVDVESSPGSQNHVESGPVDEVRDDTRPVLGQGHDLPHGHQTGMTQHTQIGQSSQDGCTAAAGRQVNDPDHHVTSLSIQPAPLSAETAIPGSASEAGSLPARESRPRGTRRRRGRRSPLPPSAERSGGRGRVVELMHSMVTTAPPDDQNLSSACG